MNPSRLFSSLYGKLVAVFVVLFVFIGAFYIAVMVFGTRLYQAEVDQTLNAELADHLVHELPMISDGSVNEESLKHAMHMMMVINPAIEIYIVDPQGKLLAFSAKPGKVKRESISLAPIQKFLSGDRYPILGDDPRHPDRRKAFSAAKIETDGQLEGYVYVVLGGELYDSAADTLAGSFIMRMAVIALAVAAVAGLLVGLFAFGLLTRRLTRVTQAVQKFQRDGFLRPMGEAVRQESASTDEVGQLSAAVCSMGDRIHQQLHDLDRADAMRRELIANVSHDLRTPLAALRGYIETLQLKGQQLSIEEKTDYLDVAIRHGDRLGKLVDQLFELAKLDTHTQVNGEAFQLAELVQDVIQGYRITARDRKINIDTDLRQDLPIVWAEIGLIERVFQNLLDNAIRHTPAGGRIEIALEPAGSGVQVAVRDSGTGIAEADLPHIFDKFYRKTGGEDENGVSETVGAGLGLAITKRILSLHGSSVEAQSSPGSGTTIQFALPLANAR